MAPMSLLGSLALICGIAMPSTASFNLFLSTQVSFICQRFTFLTDITRIGCNKNLIMTFFTCKLRR